MPTHNFSVYVDPVAFEKLLKHIRFLSQVSISAAERLFEEYDKALVFLETNPNSCPPYLLEKTIEFDFKSKLFFKRYRLVFRIDGNNVYIHDIQDCRQSLDKSLV